MGFPLSSPLRFGPDLHIRDDKALRYERVAQVMAAALQAGLRKIGFITEPVH
jgi:biopolymer transport protein ExbD